MKVLLVYPRFKYASKSGLYEPLGILYIAECIRRSGHVVRFIDLTFETTTERLKSEIAACDVVGLSATTPLYLNALEVLKTVREINPLCKVIIGGPHVTAFPDESIKDGFDVAVIGEGEATILEVLSAIQEGTPFEFVSGIAFRIADKVQRTSCRSPIENIDDIHFPGRDLLPPLYDMPVSIISGRGCPYNCTFCQPTLKKLFGSKLRIRSVGNIIQEISLLAETQKDRLGKHGITFIDDVFTVKQSWVHSFCHEFRKTRLRVKWNCNSRVNLADKDIFAEMKNAGCFGVCFGVESGSQKILDTLGKGVTIDQTKKAFGICRALGLRTFAYLMIGNPGETIQDLDDTVDLVKQIKPDGISIARTTPTPGSYLYDMAKSMGVLNTSNYLEFDYYSYARYPMKLEHLTAEDFDYYYKKIKRAHLFSRPFGKIAISAVIKPWRIPARLKELLR